MDGIEQPIQSGWQATLRVRPVTIRFTEPGVADLALNVQALSALVSVHESSSLSGSSLLFDFDAEEPASNGKGKSKATDNDLDTLDLKAHLESHLGEETVREIKYRIRHQRSALSQRRLRLIHSGRILRDGIRLVSWLDGLDEHRRLQSKTLQELAFEAGADGNDPSDTESVDDDAAEEKDEILSETVLISSLLDDTQTIDQGRGKQKQRQPDWYSNSIRVTRRTAPQIYLQCSVGETFETDDDDGVPPSLANGEQEGLPNDTAPDPSRGFDRLVDAGLSPQEIEEMRSQFRSTLPIIGSGEALRHHEEQEHLLAMEDQWMESFDLPSASSASYQTVLEGLMAGFFFPPLLALFFFKDKSQPSAVDSAEEGTADNPSGRPEQDDQDMYDQEQNDAASNIVFTKTMQISILFGLAANLIMGVFRLIW